MFFSKFTILEFRGLENVKYDYYLMSFIIHTCFFSRMWCSASKSIESIWLYAMSEYRLVPKKNPVSSEKVDAEFVFI